MYVENGVVGVSSGPVVIIDLELVIASAGHREVMPPFFEVQFVELIVEDELG